MTEPKEKAPEEQVAIAFVNGRFFHRGEQYKETTVDEVVLVHRFDGPVARVRRGYGLTLALGNYETARFDVSLDLPCHVEDIDVADEFAQRWVEQRVEKEVRDVRGNQAKKVVKTKPKY